MAEDKQVPVATLEYEPTAFEQTLLKHKSKLILVGVLAVVGTLGYWGWRLMKESKHHSAAVDFTRASTVAELKEAASKHSGQPAGGNALILAAEKQFAEGKTPDAIATLKDFLSKNPEHPLRDLASWRQAEYLASNGDTAAAEKEYEALGQANSPFTGLALLRLGDIKWGAGDKDKAQEFYDKILRNPNMTGNPAREEAQSRIDKALKTKPPTLVEYVAPLLPPPKLNTGGERGPTPGFSNPSPSPFGEEGIPFSPGGGNEIKLDGGNIKLPPGLDVNPSPSGIPDLTPVPAPPPVEEKDNKSATETGKPAIEGSSQP